MCTSVGNGCSTSAIAICGTPEDCTSIPASSPPSRAGEADGCRGLRGSGGEAWRRGGAAAAGVIGTQRGASPRRWQATAMTQRPRCNRGSVQPKKPHHATCTGAGAACARGEASTGTNVGASVGSACAGADFRIGVDAMPAPGELPRRDRLFVFLLVAILLGVLCLQRF